MLVDVFKIENRGIQFTGWDRNRMEFLEFPWYPFFVGCQFYPEYQTYPNKQRPLFVGLIKSTL